MKIFNSMTRKKEKFVPVEPGKVRIYNCGPTVYNFFHIGNARNFVVFDTLRRYFEYRGYEVTFVQNFTDIDDKMINQSIAEGIDIKDLAQKNIKEYFTDAQGLCVKEADKHPKATEHIGDIIALIKKIEKNGYAYEVEGDVYFDTSAYSEYGKLSGHQPESLEAGARVAEDMRKKNPADFALWKTAKPGEPFWNSPWGKGRPGWHVECSAMSMKYLGDTIDIHGGGQDLIFPHHENEAAQSQSATGKPFVNYWVHNGFVNVDNEKMSKSLGNFFTVREVAKLYDYEEIRFFLLSAQYRSPLNFSDVLMEQARSGLARIYGTLENLSHISVNSDKKSDAQEKTLFDEIVKHKDNFISHMDDDLNTADAISDIFNIVKDVNLAISAKKIYSSEMPSKLGKLIRELGGVLGLLHKDIEVKVIDEIQQLVDLRIKARQDKDFETSDKIRDQLKDMGVVIEDTKDGYKLKYMK